MIEDAERQVALLARDTSRVDYSSGSLITYIIPGSPFVVSVHRQGSNLARGRGGCEAPGSSAVQSLGVAHAVGAVYQDDKSEIDDARITQFEVLRKARLLSASLDCVLVPVAVERPRLKGRAEEKGLRSARWTWCTG